jgi:AcrR family transcriptional regulator
MIPERGAKRDSRSPIPSSAMSSSSRSPRKQPSQTRSTITVEAIIEAAIRIFEAEGYGGTNTIKVAARAGVSVGSLYQYFPNKLALLAGVKQRFLARLFGRLDGALAEAPDCLAGVREAIRINLEESLAARALLKQFAEELPVRLDAVTKPSEAPHVAMLRKFFRRHRRELPGRDPAMAALVVAEMVDAVTRAALAERPEDFGNGVLEGELLDVIALYLLGRPAAGKSAARGGRVAR